MSPQPYEYCVVDQRGQRERCGTDAQTRHHAQRHPTDKNIKHQKPCGSALQVHSEESPWKNCVGYRQPNWPP